jgi:Asp/Glu/hydantoin racemase
MNFGYMDGLSQPDADVVIQKGQYMGGHAIGILVMRMWQVLIPGNVANASTFQFPVRYEVLDADDAGTRILQADSTLLPDIVSAAKRLQRQGVRAIVGGCGYFGNYQEEVAAVLDVPVFLSSLMQVPLISRSLGTGKKVGIICADGRALTSETLRRCGIDDPSVATIVGAEHLEEFSNILYETGHLNSRKLEREIVTLARQLVDSDPAIRAILLECSDLPPYALSIQRAVGLPVFDFITLANWVYGATVRAPIGGFV